MKCIIHRSYIRIIQLSKFNLYLLRSIILLDSTRKTFEKKKKKRTLVHYSHAEASIIEAKYKALLVYSINLTINNGRVRGVG